MTCSASSESPENTDMRPKELIDQLVTEGGAIVSSGDCSEIEITNAQATGRFAVREDALGFVRRTNEWLARQLAREKAHPNFDARYTSDPERIKTGIELIAAERERQITAEGWSAAHDDEHRLGELSQAGACYADIAGALMHGASVKDIRDYYCDCTGPNPQWPFEDAAWKPSQDPLQNLVKAGALIAAEIDRLSGQNVKEHATLSAGASVDHGVEVAITGNHVNRAADRGCCVSTCWAS
jgi:hypothetical protein